MQAVDARGKQCLEDYLSSEHSPSEPCFNTPLVRYTHFRPTHAQQTMGTMRPPRFPYRGCAAPCEGGQLRQQRRRTLSPVHRPRRRRIRVVALLRTPTCLDRGAGGQATVTALCPRTTMRGSTAAWGRGRPWG